MNRVIVIGCPGSGKSTFARKLREITGLPLTYLDQIWHRPDQTHVSREEFDARLNAILQKDRWLIDGNYKRTLETRLKACDTVFFLDFPLEVCLSGAASRVGTAHEDFPWLETEFDEEFRREILRFPTEQLPEIRALLEKYRAGRRIFVFQSRPEADRYLETLRQSQQAGS